jgi:hypothetical protein
MGSGPVNGVLLCGAGADTGPTPAGGAIGSRAGMKPWPFGIKTFVRLGSGLAVSGGDRGAGVLFGLDVGEALLESGAGGIVTGDGLEGVFELAAVAR